MLIKESNNNKNLINRLRASKFRHVVWPIYSKELIKFAPMALLMFFILLSYNIVRSIKDSLIISEIAPEVISFIKLWIEMPAGMIMVLLYSFLCNRMSTEQVFRIIVTSFLLFFAAFAYIIFPNQEWFHPNPSKIELYVAQLPHLKWFIKIWGQWTFVIFYVAGELWPLVVFSLLFWQLANKITPTEEAKRFYSFFSFFGQSNLVISGIIIQYFSSGQNVFAKYFSNSSPVNTMIQSLMFIVLVSGIISLLLHAFIEKKIINDARYFKPQKKLKTLELGLRESISMILKSKYLWLTCILLISYSMSMNLIEGLWFSKVSSYYYTTDKCANYQGQVLLWTGLFTMLCSLIGSSIIRYFGWFVGAIITPVMILIMGVIFFSFCLAEHQLEKLLYGFTVASPALIIIFIGGLQNVLGKGTKYSLFDASKEMLYIPLDDELKTKGKAAVDIVGAKIGKSSGAIVQFIIFTVFPNTSYSQIIPFLMISFIAICIFWIYGVYILNAEYTKLLNTSLKN
jgi:ADP/ATP carrier protein family